MAATRSALKIGTTAQGADEQATRFIETFSATGNFGPFEFKRSDYGLVLQLAGTATTFNAVVERSTIDPAWANPNWVPAVEEPISVNLATTPTPPMVFTEPTRAWWRVRITAISGGNAILSMEGEA